MRAPRLVLNEWVFQITMPRSGRRDRAVVTVDNVGAEDRAFVLALARLAEVWLRFGRHP